MHGKPLLKPGLHDFQLRDMENHFLKDFKSSSTRSDLINGLKQYISKLSQIGVQVEIWLDGSFTTDKIDPNDIDLVIFALADEVNNLSNDKQKELSSLLDKQSIRTKYGCDVYFAPTEDQNLRSYWRGWFGFDRHENPKGIASIKVLP